MFLPTVHQLLVQVVRLEVEPVPFVNSFGAEDQVESVPEMLYHFEQDISSKKETLQGGLRGPATIQYSSIVVA
jgi:hypothetical protein